MELRGWWRWGQRETLDQAGTASSGVESGWEVKQNTGARRCWLAVQLWLVTCL
jgi:hypothetical protein